MFEELYRSKTGNMWGNVKNFVKHPNKFYPLEIDYGQVRLMESVYCQDLDPKNSVRCRKKVKL